MQLQYSFYINDWEKNPRAAFSGYEAGDPLELAAAGFLDIPEDEVDHSALERLFTIYNVEIPSGYRKRWMGVGDVVVLGSLELRAYRCAPLGWEPVEVPIPAAA